MLVLVNGLRKRIGAFDGAVVSRHASENAYEKYGLRSVQNFEYDSKAESADKWFRGFNYGDDRTHIKILKEEIASSDLLVLGAGNFLVDITIDLLRGPIPYLFILTLMAKMSGTPVMWYGMSVGPFRTDYGIQLTRLAAEFTDAVTVRDSGSCIALKELGYDGTVTKLPDPVLGLHPPDVNVARSITTWRQAHQRPGPVIAISVRSIPSGSNLDMKQYIESMAIICDELISHYDANLLFIPQCTYEHGNKNEDDRYIAKLVVDKMVNKNKAIVVKKDLTVDECLALYHQADAAICTRLHANVYAAIQGVPSVAIDYNPKVAGFMEWLGKDNFVVSLEDFYPQNVLQIVQGIFNSRNKLSKSIVERVEKGRKEVNHYIEIASGLITKKIE
ncbi:MAG TPA: polysaccharide pyruvyl transferase family protein [Bacillota bacterium]|nr:polysaccharide pyruvyl transferase family protein [Bacillota bacterium]